MQFPHPLVVTVEVGFQFVMMLKIVKKPCEVLCMLLQMIVCAYKGRM